MKNNLNLFTDNSQILNITNNNKDQLDLLNQNFNSSEILTDNSLSIVNKIDHNAMLQSLNQMKTEIMEIRSEERKILFERMSNYVDICKNRNLQTDAHWEQLKSKMNFIKKDNNILDLNNITDANTTIMENKEILKEFWNKNKPLGDIGDITLNEMINKFEEIIRPISEIAINHSLDINTGLSLIPAYFMFKSVVKLYTSVAFKKEPTNLSLLELKNYNTMKAKEIKTFMIFCAPLIVASMYSIKKISGNFVTNIKNNSLSNIDGIDKIKDNTFFSSIFLLKQNMPDWLKRLILFIAILFIINFILNLLDFNENNIINSIFFSNLNFIFWFFFLGSIFCLIMIFYYIFSLTLYILFSKNKIRMPIHFPQSILNWMQFIYKISQVQNEKKGIFIEFYFRLILIYIFVFCLCIFTLYLIYFNLI